ncbi:protein TBATA [Genypterus blacodes]|uniref:protein TBATA n=1 Tax=Genypterus blacodes TaxID=154954 RepID=UPI003F764604
MLTTPGPDPRGKTGERSGVQTHHGPFGTDLANMMMRSSPRFGNLSHHSFFSRHNPHPNRVRHIQGLNGRPVCMVKDDWSVTTSLFPHPLLKSNISAQEVIFFSYASAVLSEAWRDELKELAAKISLSSQATNEKKDERPEDECVRRKTQYSAQTGRLIPPPTKSHHRRSLSQGLMYPQPFYDQELMVFELLCQILQTDSLSLVQQWLLFAGQREKDLVMGMIKQALDGFDSSSQQQQHFQQLHALHHPAFTPHPPQLSQSWGKPWRTRSE